MSGPEGVLDRLLPVGDTKASCAALYESEAVEWLLDGQLHPGGDELTLRLAELAGIRDGSRVLDVASGRGRTAQLLASRLGTEVVGVELGMQSVEAAQASALAAGLGSRVRFVEGDASMLPLEDSSFDVALCECSLCLFPDKRAAVAEMARVVRPGGVVAIADVTADAASLPSALQGAMARVACVADALPLEGYEEEIRRAGLEILARERHDQALGRMVERAAARLRVARMLPRAAAMSAEVAAALELLAHATRAIERERLGYVLLVARRRGPTVPSTRNSG